MGKLILGLVIGLIAGAALIFFFFVSVPTSAQPPGRPIQPPDATVAPGSAQIVLRQEFFNEVLTTIFRDLNAPAFPLSGQPNAACDDTLKVLSEGSGAATAVRFENNRISAPLAFSGNYNSAIGCFPFSGWALGYLDLRYDAAAKSVFGQINVETVNLDGVNPILSGLITPLIQTTLNNRVNPIQILQGSQISVNAPIASAGGTLAANVEDVRAEVKDNALSLHVIYAFNGAPR
ncbi:MAG: hypothetical protein WKF34_12560 [Pyrinomonadaceae bacterium]